MTTAYYANVNPELLRWVPLAATDVLELGCGEGALAAAYKRRNPTARYTAIEAHAPSAEVARGRVDRLILADFQAMSTIELEALGRFDAIVMGDVLEHLTDPWSVLERLHHLLREDGWLALSVPNASHWTLMAELMRGRWPALDSGLFDRTHLRWFTLDSLRRTLQDSGFALSRARPRNFLLDEAAAAAWLPALGDAAARMGVDRTGFEQRARALQWVASARRQDRPEPERLHIHFAAITPDFLDVRMRLPAEALMSEASVDVSYAEKTSRLPPLPVERPKVAVVQRLALTSAEHLKSYVEAATAAGWVLVFEMDDHPDLIGAVQRSDVGLHLGRTLRGFHAVQTSTSKLRTEFSNLTGAVTTFPNALLELRDPEPRDRTRVFHGALNREGFTGQVAARLGDAAARHPEVEWIVLHDRAFFERLPAEHKVFHRAQSYDEYLRHMSRCEVVLSPLQGAPSELYKSDIKFVEAGGCRAALVASRAVYEDTVVDGRTGLLATTLDDWGDQVGRILDDGALRASLGEAARAYVARERMLATQVSSRVAWYRGLWNDRDRLIAEAKRRMEETAAP